MNKLKNLCILLINVKGYDLDRETADHIQTEKYPNIQALRDDLSFRGDVHDDNLKDLVQIMTPGEFLKFHSRSKLIKKSFPFAVKHTGKNSYGISEFMDDYNDQIFKGKAQDYWFTYVFVG